MFLSFSCLIYRQAGNTPVLLFSCPFSSLSLFWCTGWQTTQLLFSVRQAEKHSCITPLLLLSITMQTFRQHSSCPCPCLSINSLLSSSCSSCSIDRQAVNTPLLLLSVRQASRWISYSSLVRCACRQKTHLSSSSLSDRQAENVALLLGFIYRQTENTSVPLLSVRQTSRQFSSLSLVLCTCRQTTHLLLSIRQAGKHSLSQFFSCRQHSHYSSSSLVLVSRPASPPPHLCEVQQVHCEEQLVHCEVQHVHCEVDWTVQEVY